MKRIDEFPTHEKNGLKYRVGRLMPFGAEVIENDVVNFSIYSKDTTDCELLLYHLGDRDPFFILPESFIESRCFPRTRDKIKLELKRLGIPFYDPILIIEKTEGRMADDEFYIRIER